MSDIAADFAERIRTALTGRSDVIVALIFGSIARGAPRPDSDVAVAVAAPDTDLLTLQQSARASSDAKSTSFVSMTMSGSRSSKFHAAAMGGISDLDAFAREIVNG